jgi:outer membrane receptor for ferric coprogen and ferric-rhodotorulic acid
VAVEDVVEEAVIDGERYAADRAEQILVIGQQFGVTQPSRLPFSAREIPQSISEIPRELMEIATMIDINDVMMNVPGVNVTLYDTQRPLYFSRGFQITDFQVDGIPTYSNATNQEYDTALYERVEVIRGANGLFTGAGVPSATVNLVRKRPSKGFDASVSATAGSWNMRRGVGDVSVPLNADGSVRSRVVVAYQNADSFRDRYREDKTAFLGVIEADVSDDTTLAFGYQNQDNNPEGTIWGTIPIFALDGEPANFPVSTSFAPEWTKWQRESGTLFADVKHAINERWNLKAAFNRTDGEVFSLRVYATGFPDRETGEGLQLLAGIGENKETRNALDLYLTGSYTAFGRDHEVVLGTNVSQLETDTYLFAVNKWSYIVPDAWNYAGKAPKPEYHRTGAFRVATTEQYGTYAANRFRLTDQLSTIVGLRVSSWSTGTENYDTNGDFTGITSEAKYGEEVTPYAGIVYELNNALSFYASYTDIFNPQTNRNASGTFLDPVLGVNIEAGIKAEFFDKQLSANAAIFNTKQDNFAVQDPRFDGPYFDDNSFAYIAVDGTESQGIELSLSGALTADWIIHAGYTYVDTKRHESDKIWTNLPEHSAQLSTHYDLPGVLSPLTIGGGFNWQSETIGYGVSHPDYPGVGVTYEQASYALANLYATWRFNENIKATLSATNVFDEIYWANIDYANYGEPRNVSMTLKWQL